jgi:hypothetical protein
MIKQGSVYIIEEKELTEIITAAVSLALKKHEEKKEDDAKGFLNMYHPTVQAAEFLGISTDHLNRLTSEGKLEYMQGKPNKYWGAELAAYKQSRITQHQPGERSTAPLTSLTYNRNGLR